MKKIKMKFWIYFFLFDFILSQELFKKKEDFFWIKEGIYEKVKIQFDNLGFRTVCEPEIWKTKFQLVEDRLAKCLDLEKIILEEDNENERKTREFNLVFGDLNTNFYCRLAKNWMKCYKLLNEQHCIEPDPGKIDKLHNTKLKETLLNNYPVNSKMNQYDWRIMDRSYKIMCELSKVQFQISPFGPYGKNMWF